VAVGWVGVVKFEFLIFIELVRRSEQNLVEIRSHVMEGHKVGRTFHYFFLK